MKGEIIAPGQVTPHEIEEQCTQRFREAYASGIRATLAMGDVLREYREQFGHGQWESWVDHRLPIGPRTARKIIQIAECPHIRSQIGLRESVLPDDREILVEISRLDEAQFNELVDGGTIHAGMNRGDVKRALVQQSHGTGAAPLDSLPAGRYGAILADPPWRFETQTPDGMGRSPDNHYPTMTPGEVLSLDVKNLAADDCALFLWVTSDNLKFAGGVMSAWGFDLVSTAFVWVKKGQPGLGYWTRKGSEICLLGTRGSPKRQAKDVPEVIHAPRGRHSEKPDEIHERIQRLLPGPYLELFARKPREGWDAWGNDPDLGEGS